MLYDTCKTPPKAGSMLEALFLLVRAKRDTIKLAETFLIVQAIRDDDAGEATQKALDRYRKVLLPYLAEQDKKEKEAIKKYVAEEIKRGPMAIKPLMPTNTVVSRLKNISNKIRNEMNATIKDRR